MRKFVLFSFIVILIAMPVRAAKVKSAEDLVSAMRKEYAGKWYKTLTFVQKNTQFRPDGSKQNSIWYEAMSLPGKLRVDFAPSEKGNGLMFLNGEQHSFQNGKLARNQPRIHPLMVLGFDVYAQSADKTMAQLKELKFDLSIFRQDKWQDRSVYVVGAKKGDDRSSQFWIDKKRLYFVRMIQPGGRDGKSISETQFNKYQKVKGGGWIAPEVVFINNGKRVFLEEYTEMRFNVDLDENLFEPKKWAEVDKSYYKNKIKKLEK